MPRYDIKSFFQLTRLHLSYPCGARLAPLVLKSQGSFGFYSGIKKDCGIPGTARLNDWNRSPNSRRISGTSRHLPWIRKECGITRIAGLNNRNRSPDTCYISGAPDHFHRCADLHSGKKFSSKVSGHPNTTVRCRIARQILAGRRSSPYDADEPGEVFIGRSSRISVSRIITN
jgi:hypothetical protein